MDALSPTQTLIQTGANLSSSRPLALQETDKSLEQSRLFRADKPVDSSFSAPASTDVVSISTSRPETSDLYEPQALQQQTRFSRAADEILNPVDRRLSDGLEDFYDNTRWGRAAYSLGDLVRGDYSRYQQHAERSISAAGTELGALELENRTLVSSTSQAELTLQLTTRDGDVITFSYAMLSGYAEQEGGQYSFQEIALTYEVDGDLSDEEKAALADFANGLGAFARDFFTNPESTPDLASLKLFDSKQITSLNLSLQGADASFELSLEDNEADRRLTMTWTNNESLWESGDKVGRSANSLQLLISKHGATEGRYIQKDLALAQQQEIIRESLSDARATKQQKNYIQNAFSAIHQDLYFLPPEGSDAMVTGLADYSLEFAGELELPMQSRSVLEANVSDTAEQLKGNQNSFLAEGIKRFTLSQQTTIETVRDELEITQQQSMRLDASFFSPPAHLEHPDFSYQNFIYHSIEREFDIVSRQHFVDNELISATINQHFSNHETISEYNQGKVIDRWNKDRQIDQVQNSSAILRDQLDQEQTLELVEQLLAAKVFA